MGRKKKNKEAEEAKIIKSRECDVAMADKKGLLPCAGGVLCFNCVACIEKDTHGNREHHNLNQWRGAPMDGGLY